MQAQQIDQFFTDEILKVLNSKEFKSKVVQCWKRLPQRFKDMLLEKNGGNEIKAIKEMTAFMFEVCPPDFSKIAKQISE